MKLSCNQMIKTINKFPALEDAETQNWIISFVDRSISGTELPEALEELTVIDYSAFKGCEQLALASLPKKTTRIENYAFEQCFNLAITSIPEPVTDIGFMAFGYCTNLTSITFEGTPKNINSSAFSSCTNLTTINVPWAEGEVAGAPWGATNATINYNYTGG